MGFVGQALRLPISCSFQNDQMFQRRNLRRRLVGDRFDRAKLSTTISSSPGEKSSRVGAFSSTNDGGRAEGGEERHESSAESYDGKDRDDKSGDPWHAHAARTPSAQPE